MRNVGTQQYSCYSWTRLFAFLKCLLEKRGRSAFFFFDIKGMILEFSRRAQQLSLQVSTTDFFYPSAEGSRQWCNHRAMRDTNRCQDLRGDDKISHPVALWCWLVWLFITAAANWFMYKHKKDSQHIAECFDCTPQPPSLLLIHSPRWPKTPLRAQKGMTVLTEPIRAWHYCSWMCPDEFFLQGCVLSSNGLCVSGAGVRLILETGSWQGGEVDVRGVGVEMGLDSFPHPRWSIKWVHTTPVFIPVVIKSTFF